jgi:hypothetical protein
MEINDYGPRLAQAKQNYQDMAQEVKKNYEEKASNLEKLNEEKRAAQKSVFEKQKNNLEEQHAANSDKFNRYAKEEIDQRTEKYRKDLDAERTGFARDRHVTKRDYDQKLKDISDSFQTTMTEREKLAQSRQESTEERFKSGVAKGEKRFNDQLSQITSDGMDKMNKTRDQYTDEKKSLMQDHRSERQRLINEANLVKSKANDAQQLEKENLRLNHTEDLARISNNNASQREIMRKNADEQVRKMQGTFDELGNQLNTRAQEMQDREMRNSKMEKRSMEKQFSHDRNEWERNTNKLISEGQAGKGHDATKRLEMAHENRLKNLQAKMQDQNFENRTMTERVAQDYQDELKRSELNHNKNLDEKNRQIRDIRTREVASIKEDQENMIETYRNQVLASEMGRESDAITSRQQFDNRLGRREGELQGQIKQMTDAHEDGLQAMKDEIKVEQTRFYEDTRREVRKEKEDLKDDMRAQYGRREEGLEQRLNSKEQESLRMAEKYESKLSNVEKKANKEIGTLMTFQKEQRIQDQRAYQRSLEGKEREFQKTIMDVRAEFDRKLAKHKSRSDIHVAKLTERYEDQLNRERLEFSREFDTKMSMAKGEYEKLAKSSEIEKENLIQQYELKIDKLRQANMAANELKSIRTGRESSES